MSHCDCKITCSCERQNEIYKRDYRKPPYLSKIELLWAVVPFITISTSVTISVIYDFQWLFIICLMLFGGYVVGWLAYINSEK